MIQDNFIYGIRAALEAIESGKEIDKILIQKGLGGDLFKDFFIKVSHNKIL